MQYQMYPQQQQGNFQQPQPQPQPMMNATMQATPKYTPPMANGIQIYQNKSNRSNPTPQQPAQPLQNKIVNQQAQFIPLAANPPMTNAIPVIEKRDTKDQLDSMQALVKGIDRLKKENDVLQIKTDFLENFVNKVSVFDQSQNIAHLKSFLVTV